MKIPKIWPALRLKRKQTEEFFKTLFKSSPIGIYIIQDRKFQFVNPQFQKHTGYSEEELLGMDYWKIIFPEDMNIVRENAVKILKGERSSSYEYRAVNKGGKTRWIMETVTSIHYKKRRATLGNYMDITEYKQTEIELKNTINELRRTQNVLREREKLAIIGQMAAGMAHEIKNPLTAIRGFAQLLKQKNFDNEILSHYVTTILEEADQANRVINDFLQLARPKPPVLTKQSINSLIKEVLDIVGPRAYLKNVEVDYEDTSDLPHCMLDRDQFKQVLLNMCQNAIEAMPGGGNMEIKTGILPEQNEIYLDIQDTGRGISQDKLKNIGVPFYTTKAEGTGLGLSISYAIVNAHKGRIEVDSREGGGSRFRIYLPC